jgi:MOSC domain-containing protein YiiM
VHVDRLDVQQSIVVAVSSSSHHSMRKSNQLLIRLIAGHGVEGDAHAGETVKHRSRRKRTPHAPNLRQVHLIHAELHDELLARGISVGPGDMGENVTTRGIDLLSLPVGTRVRLGDRATVEITGLRNPCRQLDDLHPGLMTATLARSPNGALLRKAGVMSVVLIGGEVRPGDQIVVELPGAPHRRLEPV